MKTMRGRIPGVMVCSTLLGGSVIGAIMTGPASPECPVLAPEDE
jgi:hypothetical protein